MGIYTPFYACLGNIEFDGELYSVEGIVKYYNGKQKFTLKSKDGIKEMAYYPPEESALDEFKRGK